MTTTFHSIQFYLKYGWFHFREQFSDIPSALAANALIPFFVWLLSQVWERFNSHLGNFALPEVVVYIGLTEVLFMTFVRPNAISRASADFSLALARPRSWLLMSFSGLVGRSLGGRLFMLGVLLATFPLLGANFSVTTDALFRFFLLLPWLGVVQGVFALVFAIAQVLWHQTNYFLLPFGKVLLVLGGVWGPLADWNDPWRSWVIHLPPSDLFFQPIYFCVKGVFYQTTLEAWLFRTLVLVAILSIANFFFFRVAKHRHQAYGG